MVETVVVVLVVLVVVVMGMMMVGDVVVGSAAVVQAASINSMMTVKTDRSANTYRSVPEPRRWSRIVLVSVVPAADRGSSTVSRPPKNRTNGEMMDPKEEAAAAFSEVEGELIRISQWMYDNPEVGFEERNTSARLAEFLAGRGFAVEYPAYGLETAFAARTGSEGPEVIICAEMDALPTVGHACGHNIIAASALGAGVALAPLAEQLGIPADGARHTGRGKDGR